MEMHLLNLSKLKMIMKIFQFILVTEQKSKSVRDLPHHGKPLEETTNPFKPLHYPQSQITI